MRSKNILSSVVVFGVAAAAATILSTGCHTSGPTTAPVAKSSAEPPGKSGAVLWSENCARCHNMRSPKSYSDTEWEVTVHHMRLIAGFTGEEQRKITEFLQSAN